MKVNNVSNINFKARLCGEVKKVIDISTNAGLSKSGVKRLLNEVQRVLPSPKDKVYFYFRKNYPNIESYQNPTIRSGIKVVKDGEVMELNINPRKFQPRDLLQEMVVGVKKLVRGEVKPESTTVLYDSNTPKSWLSYYYDKQRVLSPWFKNYTSSFKTQK